ncbi:MAG TPA: hypothetical protein EYP41_20840 [Anaerolineae bacterium]|nr:hypothetical protein [Anaerolineae bacterium]HIP73396.1 hypothetical protein [Anaerolineae bacterium]
MLQNLRKRLRISKTTPAITIPIYQAAIDAREASFPLLLKLRGHMKEIRDDSTKEDTFNSLGWYYAAAHKSFRRRYGSITEMYIGDDGSANDRPNKAPNIFTPGV